MSSAGFVFLYYSESFVFYTIQKKTMSSLLKIEIVVSMPVFLKLNKVQLISSNICSAVILKRGLSTSAYSTQREHNGKIKHKCQSTMLFSFICNQHKWEHRGFLHSIQLTGLLNSLIFYSNYSYFLLSSVKVNWHGHNNEINK